MTRSWRSHYLFKNKMHYSSTTIFHSSYFLVFPIWPHKITTVFGTTTLFQAFWKNLISWQVRWSIEFLNMLNPIKQYWWWAGPMGFGFHEVGGPVRNSHSAMKWSSASHWIKFCHYDFIDQNPSSITIYHHNGQMWSLSTKCNAYQPLASQISQIRPLASDVRT